MTSLGLVLVACANGQTYAGDGGPPTGADRAPPDASSAAVDVAPSDATVVVDRCNASLRLCAGSCVDVTNDPAHCGRCDNPCAAGQTCAAGACTSASTPACAEPRRVCNGTCTDVASDRANCGGCGVACPGAALCVAGRCVADCSAPRAMCGATCVDVSSDPANCGACGVACPAGQRCTAGRCAAACSAGQILCGGACVNPNTDRNNCGRCGNVCGGTLPFCVYGFCVSADDGCSVGLDCSTCTLLPNCGWCATGATTGGCLGGNDSGSHAGPCATGGSNWTFRHAFCPSPDPCSASTTCDACARTAGCGWCSSTNTCMSGTATGPSTGMCASTQWQWDPSFCASHCSTYASCGDCISDPGCGWCGNVGHCMTGTADGPDSTLCSGASWSWAACE